MESRFVAPRYYDLSTGRMRSGSPKGWLLAASIAMDQVSYGRGADPSFQNVLDMNAWSKKYGSMQPSTIDLALGLQGPPGREVAVSGLLFNAFNGKTGMLVSACSKLAHMGYNEAISMLSPTEKAEFDYILSNIPYPGSEVSEYGPSEYDVRAADPTFYGPFNEETEDYLQSLRDAEIKKLIREGFQDGVISPLVQPSVSFEALKRAALSWDARHGNYVDYLRGVPSSDAWNYVKESGLFVTSEGEKLPLSWTEEGPVVESRAPDVPGDKKVFSLPVYGDPDYPIETSYGFQRNGSPRKTGTVQGYPEP